MPRLSCLSSSLVALLAVVACTPRPTATDALPAAAAAAPAGEITPESTPARAAPAPTAFECHGGHRVDVGPRAAVVRLADGRSVRIARAPGDASRFVGEALAFHMTGTAGELSQDEGGRFTCRAAGAP